MESKYVEAQGIRMRWEESGEGPPVVFVHGILTSPRLWRHVIPRVEGRALAWEMVGYGASIREGWKQDISVAHQAEYLAGWMREIGLDSAVIVGHDLGGGVAQILAVRTPELVRGLVLTNAICYDSWPIPSVKATRAAGPLSSGCQMPSYASTSIWVSFCGVTTTGRGRKSRSPSIGPTTKEPGAPRR